MSEVAISPLRDRIGASLPDELVSYINKLVYGDPGAGKTYLLGTAADSEHTTPSLVIDIEGGTRTIYGKNVDVKRVTSIAQLSALYAELHSDIKTDENGVQSLYYKSIMLDSISELQKLDMDEIMTATVALHPERNKSVPAQREWGITGDHMRAIIRKFRDLPCNVIVTALATETVDQNTNRKSYGPSLPGKLKNEVAGFFDIVGFLYTAQDETGVVRQLQFAKTPSVVAKDRTGKLGDLMINPTILDIWNLINSKPAEKATVTQVPVEPVAVAVAVESDTEEALDLSGL